MWNLIFLSGFYLQTFARSTGISLSGPAEDPKVASWLLDPGAKERNLHQLIGQHVPEEAPLLEGKILLLLYKQNNLSDICLSIYFENLTRQEKKTR